MSTKVNIEEVTRVKMTKTYKFHNMYENKVYEQKPPPSTPCLPPLPALQRPPTIQYKISQTSLTERAGTSSEESVSNHSSDKCASVTKTAVRLTERNYSPYKLLDSDAGGVSKLVMKNVSRGTTRKKALIHSIPKFSQV